MTNKQILKGVETYYSEKVKLHGDKAEGVDWNSKESQYLRFQQLSHVITTNTFSILDVGCGYGEYIHFLTHNNYQFDYTGYDVSNEMLQLANKKFNTYKNCKFIAEMDSSLYDYAIASGIFNVRLNLATNQEWLIYIKEQLTEMHTRTRMGFAFNALTSYSDTDKMKDYLYYANPLELFDFCKRNFGKNVALLHDYNLYEFSIIVRKNG